MERVTLNDSRSFAGLVRSEETHHLEFVEVRRLPGRPMYLVVRRFPADTIAEVISLAGDERKKLAERIERFKSRAADELAEMAQMTLNPGRADGPAFVYEGPWFRLESWTDQEMTRRAAVRMEQVFAAYSEILPVRVQPARAISVRLYGSMRDYARFQEELEFRFENPAVYIPRLNLLAAGSELSVYAERLAAIRRKHAELRAKYEKLAAAMPGHLQKLSQDLEKNGFPESERKSVVLAAQRSWDQQRSEVERNIAKVERENNAQFDQVTRQMFARLYHEAFHAYLANFVYPEDRSDVPRWLNEGLAQIFEDGLLELGTLRLDAPSAKRLAALQADLRSSPRFPLAELLTSDGRAFLVDHPTNFATSERHYLYSWGLAYYLAVREPVIEIARLNRYVDRSSARLAPVARFEALVGQPLDQFEQKWREAMLAMKIAPGTMNAER